MHRAALDLNADLGEAAGFDAELLELVTSANVSCGAHAGSAVVAGQTCALAAAAGVVVGAHPGHPDPEHLGRRPLPIASAELSALLDRQLGVLEAAAAPQQVRYLKLHGALYHQASEDPELAAVVVAAAAQRSLMLLAPPASALAAQAHAAGLGLATEGFVDRAYELRDGRPALVDRAHPGALLGPEAAAAQAIALATTGEVRGLDGSTIHVAVRSLCLHGDTPQAVVLARQVRAALNAAGIALRAFAA